MTLRKVLMEVVLDIRYFYVFTVFIVAAQLKDQCLNVRRDLLLRDTSHQVRHPKSQQKPLKINKK